MTATADRQMELTLPMVPDIEIAAARAAGNLARELGMASEAIDEMAHAIIEACINAREHSGSADKRIYVRIAGTSVGEGDSRIDIWITDRGRGFDVTRHAPPLEARRRSQRGWVFDHRSAHGRGRDFDQTGWHDDHMVKYGRVMTDELRVAVDRRGANGAILYTKGYINNVGGEEIVDRAYELMDADVRGLLLNLRETKIVNSIGMILIEIIEEDDRQRQQIGFCCLTPVIHKTFQIMGLANYAAIYNDRKPRSGRWACRNKKPEIRRNQKGSTSGFALRCVRPLAASVF
jgi:anti-sigma regulatory factor (Ser/Thr protein kinase)/anti-anti-sigma regulatory factor